MATTIDNYKIKIDVDGTEKIKAATDGLKGFAGALLGVGVLAFARQCLQLADSITDLAHATGMSVGAVARLQGALQQAGGSADNAGKMIAAFYNKIDDAANGVESAQKALGNLGITFTDLGNLTEQQLFDKAIHGLAEMEAGSKRTALGMAVFGKSFKDIDPQELERILATGNFDDFAAAAEHAAIVNEKIERTFRNLQIAGVEAIDKILSFMEPFIGKISETDTELDKARKTIEVVGIALAVAFGAELLMNAIKFLKFMEELNILTKAQAVLQAIILSLQGPKGWLQLAGAAAAAAAAIYGVNKAYDEYIKTTQPSAGGGRGFVNPANVTPSVGAGPVRQTQLYSDEELRSRQQAVAAAKATTNELREQDKAAQAYLRTVISTVEMDKDKAANIIRNADLERQANDKILSLEKQISDEKSKGYTVMGQVKGVNDGLITQYQAQIAEVKNNLEITKQLKQQEVDRLAIIERQRAAIQNQINDMNMAIEQGKKSLELDTQRAVISGKSTQEEASRLNQSLQLQMEHDRKITELTLKRKLARTQLERDTIDEEIKMTENQYALQNTLMIRQFAQEEQLRQSGAAGARAAMEQITRSMDPYMLAQQRVNALWGSMTTAIDNFVDNGKFSFSDFATSVIKDLIKIELKASAMNLWNIMKGAGGGGGGGGFWSTVGSLLGFAGGGDPPVGKPSVVGENGPELFIPKTAGTIIPNNAIGGTADKATSQIVNNYHINAIDAKSVAQLFAENRRLLLGSVRAAEKELPYRTR